MESAETAKESSVLESFPEPALASVNKDQPHIEVPDDTCVKVVLELRVSVTGGSKLVNVQDASSSMTPQQGQGSVTSTQYPKLRVRKDSTDTLLFEQKVGETEPQESVAIYPQLKVSQGISDELLLEEDASVSSSNSEGLTDPRDEGNLTSSVEYNSVSQQTPEGLRSKYVQHQYVFDLPVTLEQDASSTSARTGMPEFEDEFREFCLSDSSEAKRKSKFSPLEDGGFATYAQGWSNEVNNIPSSSSQIMPTKSSHSRRISDDVRQANHAGHIDTAAPYESAKGIVIKFGGIVDWNPHRMHAVEKRKDIDEELETMHKEVQWFRNQSEAAENDKVNVLKALNSSKRLIEELNLYLGRAQMEQHQAKQDSELSSLRVVAMEQGIADEASNEAKTQFEVAKARHDAALSELVTRKEELVTLRKDYATLLFERDLAVKKAEVTLFASQKIKKIVKELTIELIATRESLESQNVTRSEAEEQRIGATMPLEQDTYDWEKETKQEEEEFGKLDQNIRSAKDLKSKLDIASAFLRDVKLELAAYTNSDLNLESEEHSTATFVGQDKKTHNDIQTTVSLAKKNLEQVKLDIEETNEEIRLLEDAATSLKLQLESEKLALATLEQSEGIASLASIEAELNWTLNEISMVQVKEREAKEEMVELPKKLQKAAEEEDQAKSLAHAAHEALQKAQVEVEHAKAGASTVQSRLLEAQKEIEASKASKQHAVAALSALQETEAVQTLNNDQTPSEVALPLEEYNELNKQAQDAEEQANKRIADSLSLVEKAKETKSQNLSKLEKVNSKLASRKDKFESAREKAVKAQEEKLVIEQELRKWRAEHEQQRKAGESSRGDVIPSKSSEASFEEEKTETREKRNPLTSFEVKNEAQYLNKAPSAAAATQNMQSAKEYEPKRSESDSLTDVKLKKKKRSKILRFFSFSGKKKKSSPSLNSSPSGTWN